MSRLAPLALLALVCAAPLALAATTPQQMVDRAQSSRPFAAAPRAAFTIDVADAGDVQLGVVLRSGSADDFHLNGPGRCVAARDIEAGRASVTLDCGWLQPGRYRVSILVDGGSATGSLRTSGASFAVA